MIWWAPREGTPRPTQSPCRLLGQTSQCERPANHVSTHAASSLQLAHPAQMSYHKTNSALRVCRMQSCSAAPMALLRIPDHDSEGWIRQAEVSSSEETRKFEDDLSSGLTSKILRRSAGLIARCEG